MRSSWRRHTEEYDKADKILTMKRERDGAKQRIAQSDTRAISNRSKRAQRSH
jgi:hypothetical protein